MNFQDHVVIVGLQKLFNESFFSVCKLDELCSLFARGSVRLPSPYKEEFQVLHCVHYTQMPREVRKELPRRVIEACAACAPVGVEVDVDAILAAFAKAQGVAFSSLKAPEASEQVEPVVEKGFFRKLSLVVRG